MYADSDVPAEADYPGGVASPPTIPDMTDIEGQKENILPLKEGRKVSTLAALYTSFPDDHSRATYLATTRQSFEDELAILDDLDDPLDVFHRYVKWIQEHYTTGQSSESELVAVLERAVRKFKGDGRYRNDPRYLRLWLLLAKNASEPVEVFKYLSVNEIAQELALYYEEYATLMEQMGKFREADDIFQLGIARQAQPLERLNRRFADFQKRIITKGLSADDDALERTTTQAPSSSTSTAGSFNPSRGDENASIVRQALATRPLGTVAAPSESDPSRMTQVQEGRRPSAGPARNARSTKLSVFRDDGTDPPSAVLPTSGTTNAWPEYGTTRSRKKENSKEATPWNGVTISGGVAPATREEKVEVFRDESEGLDHHAEPKSAPTTTLREMPSKSVATTSSMLTAIDSARPSRSSYASRQQESLHGQTTKAHHGKADPSSKPKRPERLTCDMKSIYRDDQEFSFEELRAAATLPTATFDYSCSPPSSTTIGIGDIDAASTASFGRRTDHKEQLGPAQPTAQPRAAQLSSSPPAASVKPTKRQVPSPTINTKAALADVYDWFNQPLEEDEEETVSNFDAVMAARAARGGVGADLGIGLDQAQAKVTVFPGKAAASAPGPMVTAPTLRDENGGPRGGKLQVFRDAEVDEQATGAPSAAWSAGGISPPVEGVETAGKIPVFRDDGGSTQGTAEGATWTGGCEYSDSKETFAVFTDVGPDVAAAKAPRVGSGSDDASIFRGSDAKGMNALFGLRTDGFDRLERKEIPSFDDIAGAALGGRERDVASSAQQISAGCGSAPSGCWDDESFVHHTHPYRPPPTQTAPGHPVRHVFDEDAEEEEREAGGDGYRSRSAATPGYQVRVHAIADSTPHQSRFVPPHPQDQQISDGEQGYRRHRHGSGGGGLAGVGHAAFDILTPITEASEFTESIGSRRSFTESVGRPSVGGSTVGGGGAGLGKALFEDVLDGVGSLRVVDEEDEDGREEEYDEKLTVGRGVRALQEEGDVATVDVELPSVVDPTDEALIATLGKRVERDMTSFAGFHDHRPAAMGNMLRIERGADPEGVAIELAGSCYVVGEKLGEGGFAKIYLAHEVPPDGSGGEEDEDVASTSRRLPARCVAIKLEAPPMVWEAWVIRHLHTHLSPTSRKSIVRLRALDLFMDESYLALEHLPHGTLLDAVNVLREGTAGLPEVLAMWMAVEVLKTVEAVHGVGIVHGDIKADNFMVRLDPLRPDGEDGGDHEDGPRRGGDSGMNGASLSAGFDAGGSGGWGSRGVTLIDWGRAMDMRLMRNRKFRVPTDETMTLGGERSETGQGRRARRKGGDEAVESWEVRSGREFTYEADWYGVAGIVHVLLFGKYMKVVEEWDGQASDGSAHVEEGARRPRLRLAAPLKRYWKVELWDGLFRVLLNSGSPDYGRAAADGRREGGGACAVDPWMVGAGSDFAALESCFPAIVKIRKARKGMERYLGDDSAAGGGKTLKVLLRRLEYMGMDGSLGRKK